MKMKLVFLLVFVYACGSTNFQGANSAKRKTRGSSNTGSGYSVENASDGTSGYTENDLRALDLIQLVQRTF